MYKSIFKPAAQESQDEVVATLTMEHELLAYDLIDAQVDAQLAQEALFTDGAQRLESVYTECKEAIDAGQCTPVLMDQYTKRVADITQGTLVLRDMTEESFSDEVTRDDAYTMTNESMKDKIAEVWKVIKDQANKIWVGIQDLFAKLFSSYDKLEKALEEHKAYFSKSETTEFVGDVKVTSGLDRLHMNGSFDAGCIKTTMDVTSGVANDIAALAIEQFDGLAKDVLVKEPKNVEEFAKKIVFNGGKISKAVNAVSTKAIAGGKHLVTESDDVTITTKDASPLKDIGKGIPRVSFEDSKNATISVSEINLTKANVVTLVTDAIALLGKVKGAADEMKKISTARDKAMAAAESIIKDSEKGALAGFWAKESVGQATRLVNSAAAGGYKKITSYEFGVCRAAAAFAANAKSVSEATK